MEKAYSLKELAVLSDEDVRTLTIESLKSMSCRKGKPEKRHALADDS
jgi:hypothetical protein